VDFTVTASGLMLPPYVIFNAKPNGHVERELANFPPGAHYAIQKNVWMDERVMIMWVEAVLEPYVKTAPDGERPILFLDSYRCHMMASVVQRVQDLGVEVQHIPGGCMGVCQPVMLELANHSKIASLVAGKTGWSKRVVWAKKRAKRRLVKKFRSG
jgi:hypothetical protein